MSDQEHGMNQVKVDLSVPTWPTVACQRCGEAYNWLISVLTLYVDPGHPDNGTKVDEHWCLNCVVTNQYSKLMFEDA